MGARVKLRQGNNNNNETKRSGVKTRTIVVLLVFLYRTNLVYFFSRRSPNRGRVVSKRHTKKGRMPVSSWPFLAYSFLSPHGPTAPSGSSFGPSNDSGKKSPRRQAFSLWGDFSLCIKKATHGPVHLIGQLFSVSQQKIEKTASPREKRSTTSVHGASPLAGDSEKSDKEEHAAQIGPAHKPTLFSHTNKQRRPVYTSFFLLTLWSDPTGRTFCLSTLDPFFPSSLFSFPLVAARANTSSSSWSIQQTPTLDRRPIPT